MTEVQQQPESTGAAPVHAPAKGKSRLEEFEHDDGRPAFILTYTEVKLLGIAGVSLIR